jgi:exodeoxyribonuclease VII large subunit
LLERRLHSAQDTAVNRSHQRYLTAAAKLDALSPLKVLTRGYALVQSEDGVVLRSVKDTHAGDEIDVRFNDGSIRASVIRIEEKVL